MALVSPPANPTTTTLSAVLPQLEKAVEALHELWLLGRGYKRQDRARALVTAIGDALTPLFGAYSSDKDPVEQTFLAGRQLGAVYESVKAASDAAWSDHARALVGSCAQQLTEVETRLRQMPPSAIGALPLAASLEAPALQRGTTEPILPTLGVTPPNLGIAAPPRPEAIPTGFDPDALPALTAEQWTEFHARDCFSDVVALLPQRVSQLGEAWALADVIERRLVANLDAIASLGDAGYRAIEQACQTAVVIDAALCGGLGLLSGGVASRDLLALSERLLLVWETDEAMWQAMADAWKLSPSPWLGGLCDRFIRSADLRKQALAFDVLGYRGWLTAADVQRALEAGQLPLAGLLSHLHYLSPPDRESWLRRLYGSSATQSGDPALWWASALNGYQPLPVILEHSAPSDATGEGWLILALYGERYHAEMMLSSFTQSPTPELARALGWAGLGASIPTLIAALSSDAPALKNAVAMALERITGAGLFEEVPIDPEQAMTPDVPEPVLGPTTPGLASELSDARDAPPEGSPDTLLLPAVTRETWDAYWRVNAARFAPEARFRRGLPASPAVFVDELEYALRTPGDRRLIHKELIMRTGRRVHFDPHQWVAEQRVALEQWRAAARSCPVPSGTWFRLGLAF